MPALPLFTFTALILTALIWSENNWLLYNDNHWLIGCGMGLVLFSAVCSLFSWLHFRWRYDLFAFGCILAWYPWWRIEYRVDTPMFYFFPIYFVLFSVVVSYFLLHQRQWVTEEDRKMIRLFDHWYTFHPAALGLFVPLSVWARDYYIFYPIVMTLLMMRYVFSVFLERD